MRDRQSRQSPYPRKQFIKDLIEFINEKRSANHDIMLNLDANEIMGKETQGISKLMRECGLVNLLDIPGTGPEGQLQDTYRQGTSPRIDFMLGTARVHSSIRRSGALEYNDGIVSDHRGLYVDLDPMLLFGGNTDDPVAASSRGFTSKKERK
jgi:exonuclease III